MNDWWTTQDAALIGAIGGSLVGVIGGLFGSAVGICAPRGIARGPVLGTHAVLIVLGGVVLLGGVTALLAGQPFHVFFPLLLCGFILTSVFGALLPVVRQRYSQSEERRMEAENLRRG
jgi:hypothetical protein